MAKKFSPEYEPGDILSLYTQRSQEGDESRIRDLSIRMRELCRLEHTVWIPPTYEQQTKALKTPFIRDSWHRITSSLCSKSPVVHILSKDERKKDYREAASLAERWDQGLFESTNKELGTDIIYDLTAKLVRDGSSILKVVHRPDAWANFPMGVGPDDQDQWKRGAALPIAWLPVDRLRVVYEGGEYGDAWFLEYGEYARPYLKSKYKMVDVEGRLQDPKHIISGPGYPEGLMPSSTSREVKVEFFTDREWHVLVGGVEAPGWPKHNPYRPYLPYIRARAYEDESLLYSLLYLVPRLDELLTMKINWGILTAYPNPVIESLPGQTMLDMPLGDPGEVATGPAQPKLQWTPGKAIEMPEGKTIKFLEPPPSGKDMNDLISILKGLIDIAGIPSVMRGVGFAGDSGYLANEQRASAEMAYKLAASSLQRQLGKGLDLTHWMVQNIVRQTVYALGWSSPRQGQKPSQEYLGLSPDKTTDKVAGIDKLGMLEVRFRPQLVTDEQGRAMIALQLTNSPKPLYSRRMALEKLMQEEDADSILDDIAVEDALNEEPLKSVWISEGLREAGINLQDSMSSQGAAQLPGQIPSSPGQSSPASPGQSLGQPGQIPSNGASVAGQPGVPGLTMPMEPGPPQGGGSKPTGVPGRPGGRAAGTYPGRPGNQGP